MHEHFEMMILPFFGNMNIEDIDWRDIQGFYDKNSERSFSTVHKFRVVISRLMQIAVGDGLIHKDPTKDKRLSYTKRKSIRPVPNTETYKELLSSIDSLEEHHERLYMAILGYTGLRKGEILALKWNDISLKESLIHVKRSIVIAGTSIDNPGIIKSPKTEAGIRMVPIAEPLKKILISHKTSDEFIITNQKTGRPVHNGSDFETMWRHIGSQIDLGLYTSHSFRHAMCSTLLSSGVDVKTAQTILGHSQPSTTLNIYAHAIPNKIKEAGLIFSHKMSS